MQELPHEVQVRIMSFLPCSSLMVLSKTVPFTRMFDDRLWQTLCKERYGIDKNFFLIYPQEASKRYLEISQRFEITERLYQKEELLKKALWQGDLVLLAKLCRENPDLARKMYEKRNVVCLDGRLLSYRSMAQELNLPFSWTDRLLCFVEEGHYHLVTENIEKIEDRTLVICKLLSRGEVTLALSLKREKIEKCVLLSSLLLSRKKQVIVQYMPVLLSRKLNKDRQAYILSHAYASGDEEIFTYFEKLFSMVFPPSRKIACFVKYYENSKDVVHFCNLVKEHLGKELRQDVRQMLLQCDLSEINYLIGRGHEVFSFGLLQT
nr:hypothetical protein Cplu_342 [Cedratvirus plubellavi]